MTRPDTRRRRDRPKSIQRHFNFHFSVTIDLFARTSVGRTATFYNAGLKAGPLRGQGADDHRLRGCLVSWKRSMAVVERADAERVERSAARRLAIKDSVGSIGRWNKVMERAGSPRPHPSAQGVQPEDRHLRHRAFAGRPGSR